MSANNPQNSGATNVNAIKRVGYDKMDGVEYFPNHVREQQVRTLDTTLNPNTEWGPGQQITWAIERRDFNPLRSTIDFDLVIDEIPCYDDIVTIIGRTRQLFRSSIRSRPGALFADLPFPVENIDKAMFAVPYNIDAVQYFDSANSQWDRSSRQFKSVTYDRILSEFNKYISETNDRYRTFNRTSATLPFMSNLGTVPFETPAVAGTDNDFWESSVEINKIIKLDENRGHDYMLSSSYPSCELGIPVGHNTRFAAWMAQDTSSFDVVFNSNENLVPTSSANKFGNYSLFYSFSATGTDTSVIMAQPGAVLNYRLRMMQLIQGSNPYMHPEYMRNTQLTPDECIAAYDPYGFVGDTSINCNDSFGLSLRNIGGIINEIRVGTQSNPSIITNYNRVQDCWLIQSANYEQDSNMYGSSAFWSTGAIPSKFQWKGFANSTMGYYHQHRINPEGITNPNNQAAVSLFNTDGSASAMTTYDRRFYMYIANPFPFYHESIVIPVKIPLSTISGFFNDDFIPHTSMTEQLQISFALNQLGSAFDFGKTCGYHIEAGQQQLDITSFGNAYQYISQVLQIQNWKWKVKNANINVCYLHFAMGDTNVESSVAQEVYMQRYLGPYFQGIKRGYFHLNPLTIGSTAGNDLPTVEKQSAGAHLITQHVSLNEGVLAQIFFYHTLDGCNGAYVPLHDACSIEMGTNQNWRFPANQNEVMTMEDQHRRFLEAFNRTDSHITNVAADFVYRYGMPSMRTQTITREYFITPRQIDANIRNEYSKFSQRTDFQSHLFGTYNNIYSQFASELDPQYGASNVMCGSHNLQTDYVKNYNYNFVKYGGLPALATGANTGIGLEYTVPYYNYYDRFGRYRPVNSIGEWQTNHQSVAIYRTGNLNEAHNIHYVNTPSYPYSISEYYQNSRKCGDALTTIGMYKTRQISGYYGNTVPTDPLEISKNQYIPDTYKTQDLPLDRNITQDNYLYYSNDMLSNVNYFADSIRSLTSTWTHKKLSYEDTCFGVIDFRGDAPTPGTAYGITMSGISTSTNYNNSTFRANFYLHDYSIGERFANRRFEHRLINVQERVAYYVPTEGNKLRLTIETGPSIFTTNAV